MYYTVHFAARQLSVSKIQRAASGSSGLHCRRGLYYANNLLPTANVNLPKSYLSFLQLARKFGRDLAQADVLQGPEIQL
jgi:hypothetical protein